jgi:acyl-CoA thioester hydrolase
MTKISRQNFNHFVPITVRWGEMDALGHVNNTVFYRYSEDGRLDYISRMTGDGPSRSAVGPILADLRCSFLQQLRFPASVEIATRTRAIGRSSLKVQQALYRAGEDQPVAGYEAVVVWFDYGMQKSVPVPEEVRARIREIEVVAPEE